MNIFFSSNFIFLSICEAFIHSMWTSDKKVMENLVFKGFNFECNFHNLSKILFDMVKYAF